MKRTLVLGASEKPDRYSNKAIARLVEHNHPVIAIGNRAGSTHGVKIELKHPVSEEIDTVTLYLNPNNQKAYYDYILGLKPKRIIFNPGTENPELVELATAAGIECTEACTLVLLGTNQY